MTLSSAISDIFNPSSWGIHPDSYREWWVQMMKTTLDGFITKFIAAAFLALSMFFFTSRNSRHGLSYLFLAAALFVAYMADFFLRIFYGFN